MENRLINVGEPAPWFSSRSTSSNRYHIDTVAGRYIVLAFYGSAITNFGGKINSFAHSICDLFDDDNLCFFGISNDSDDESQNKVTERIPGIRYFWDFDKKVSNLYKVINPDGVLQEIVYVLDPMLRVIGLFKFSAEEEYFSKLHIFLKQLPKIKPAHLAIPQAPVLVIPYVFEPALCKALIAYYDKEGGEDSGFMREVDGKTVGMLDYNHKRRRDCNIEDKALKTACMNRIHDRLIPAIERAFQFKATRMERYIIGCYDANEQAHFRAHRDNTTPSTAYRKFAVSLFLNTGEYEGGFLKFPEFGSAHYIAPAGGAIVFSCSLLHEATRVTNGKRYMFLPFLYDDAAAIIRQDTASLIVGLSRESATETN